MMGSRWGSAAGREKMGSGGQLHGEGIERGGGGSAMERRGERKRGVRSTCGQMEGQEGAWPRRALKLEPPGHERRAVGWRQPGDGDAVSRMGEAGKEREGRQRGRLAGGLARGVGPACQGRKERGEREWQVGPGLRLNVFELISKVFKLDSTKTKLPKF
jgi:hypothetical protein